MSRPRRLGLIGCGLMGAHYADVFARTEGAVIAACCDPTPEKLDRFGDRAGIASRYQDYRKMLDGEKLDGVLNVTPDDMHGSVVAECLERRLPLLTEKPLVGSWEECVERGLAGTAEAAGGKAADAERAEETAGGTMAEPPDGAPVLVNFSKRNAAAVEAAGKIAASGALGRLLGLETSYRQGWVFSRDWGDWREEKAWRWRMDVSAAPLGVLSDLGSHLIDLVRHVSGRDILAVSGGCLETLERPYPYVSPDRARGILHLDGPLSCGFTASRIDVGEKDRLVLTVYGEEGLLSLDLQESRRAVGVLTVRPVELPGGLFDTETGETIRETRAGRTVFVSAAKPPSVYEAFLETLNGGNPAAPRMADGIAVQAVMEALRLSAEAGGKRIGTGSLTEWDRP